MPKTMRELLDAIEEESGVDVQQMPQAGRFMWHPRRTAIEVSLLYPTAQNDQERQELIDSLKPTFWNVNQPVPVNPGMVVFAFFEDSDEARFYAVSTLDPNNPEAKPAGPPTLFRLAKNSPVPIFSQTSMSYETFQSVIANEWSELESGISSGDRERETILDFLEHLPADYSVRQAAQDVRNEVHLDGQDEEEEPAAQTQPNGAPAHGASPVESVVATNR